MRHSLPPVSEGEIVVIGLGRSGVAAAELLHSRGYSVHACDDGASPAVADAASRLERRGISTRTGGHDAARIARASLVVLSPGVPPDAAPMVAARSARRELISEIEVGIRCEPSLRYVAITGTNGKTTTTALVGHILRGLGVRAADAGNIGTPLSEVVNSEPLPELVSLELSSFQLHDTPSIDPLVGVLTNLSADHLDRYASVSEYFADKAMLFRNSGELSRWIINADDNASTDLVRGVAGTRHDFSIAREADGWYDRKADTLVVFGQVLLRRAELNLLGDHNVANTLAASLAVMVASEEYRSSDAMRAIASAVRTFRAMPNRLEVAGEWGGVAWINDSKATNVASTLVAVQGMTRPTILLLGGRHKGEPYNALADPVAGHVKLVIAYGEAAPIVEADLKGVVPLRRIDGSFEDVIAAARDAAEPGDAVLLSPACSSYDMFRNYVERGDRFRELAGMTNG